MLYVIFFFFRNIYLEANFFHKKGDKIVDLGEIFNKIGNIFKFTLNEN